MMREYSRLSFIKLHRNYISILILIIIVMMPTFTIVKAQAAGAKTYTVNASSVPYKNIYTTEASYNNRTRQYYMLRSYLERLEKDGGGTLILSKGTYEVTNTLYVPSHVTILLKDGVMLRKGNTTGSSKLTPSKTLFELIAPSKAGKKGAVSNYNGETAIQILGEGTARIDLNFTKDSVGIVIGHNSGITVKGISFQNMYGGNFIKIGASKEVTLQNNSFNNHKDSSQNNQEAIVLEIPDPITKAFTYPWNNQDKTSNKDITIENNIFYQLERAIGSTKYTENLYQSNIEFIGNTITKTDSHAMRILNWENCTVEGNHFSDIKNSSGSLKAILVSGAKNPTITLNTFTHTDRAIQIEPWMNTGSGSSYAITYNVINSANKADMLKNSLSDMGEYVIRYNKTYNEFTQNTEKWEIYDTTVKNYKITPDSEPFQNIFKNYSTYNNYTRQYYVIRSYLEQLERIGGGSLTLEKGTYNITNSLYIPSHVTITLEDGVIINKAEQTGVSDMPSAKSIFIMASPTKSKIIGAYGGYNGETDIQIIGKGTAVIDLNFIDSTFAITMGHNTNVVISGITFQNMKGGHFIELDASQNVTIENSSFLHHKPSATGIKEAINIDTPDKSTGGFNYSWTNYDCTPDKDIIIRNNSFDDLERAIGTHKYSGGKYHDNIQILNNTISNTDSDAIRILNWTKPVIKGNVISMVSGGTGGNRAILASGVSNPTITNNTFSDIARPIQIMPWKNSGGGSQYDITYNSISSADLALMLKNYLIRVTEKYIRVNKTYNVFDSNTDKYYYSDEYIKQY